MKGTETMKPFARMILVTSLAREGKGECCHVEMLPMTMLPIANERKTAMKKLMVATGCTAMAAIVGCADARKTAESYGIIGGEDGPTAIWMTTRLPWSKDCPQEK